MGWKWAHIGGLQYQTHMQAPKYDVLFLRSEALRSSSSSSSSSSRTRQIKECYITRNDLGPKSQHEMSNTVVTHLAFTGHKVSCMEAFCAAALRPVHIVLASESAGLFNEYPLKKLFPFVQ